MLPMLKAGMNQSKGQSKNMFSKWNTRLLMNQGRIIAGKTVCYGKNYFSGLNSSIFNPEGKNMLASPP